MQAQLIQELKRLLIHSENFHTIQGFFDDHIDKAPWLLDMSEKAENEDIHAICVASCQKIDERTQVKSLELRYAPAQQFWHGDVHFNGKLGFVFYFDDIDKGMLLHINDNGRSRRCRFTARRDIPFPSMN